MRYAVVCLLLAASFAPPTLADDDPLIDQGRYLTRIAGCGDCHTPGYILSGVVDEAVWLTGDTLGFRGEWGTTYPTNLRLRLTAMDEAGWVAYARQMRPRPPMPWFNVAAMTDEDLRAIYRYVRHLGPAGDPAPDFVPPDKTPAGPVLQFPMPPPPANTDDNPGE